MIHLLTSAATSIQLFIEKTRSAFWSLPLLVVAMGQVPFNQQTTQAAPADAPFVLPGRGLAEHDFFYAGEGKEERMFIVRKGRVVWSYIHPGRGEISDAILQPSGHILFAHQFGITEIAEDKT